MIVILTKDLKSNEYTKEISTILKEFSIYHVVLENEIHVFPQKIVLSEIDMNYIFSEVFIYFEYLLRYGATGGDGCEFSLELF